MASRFKESFKLFQVVFFFKTETFFMLLIGNQSYLELKDLRRKLFFLWVLPLPPFPPSPFYFLPWIWGRQKKEGSSWLIFDSELLPKWNNSSIILGWSAEYAAYKNEYWWDRLNVLTRADTSLGSKINAPAHAYANHITLTFSLMMQNNFSSPDSSEEVKTQKISRAYKSGKMGSREKKKTTTKRERN